jgi:hypothetical protein
MKSGRWIHTIVIACSILIGAGLVARAIRSSPRYAYQWFPGEGQYMSCWLRVDNRTGHVEYYYPTNKAWAPWER